MKNINLGYNWNIFVQPKKRNSPMSGGNMKKDNVADQNDFNSKEVVSNMEDVSDEVILGIYEGKYFKRKDVSGINKTGAMEVEESFDRKESESSSKKYRDNLRGMMIIVRILTRTNRLTDDLVKRYAEIYDIDEKNIRMCERHAYVAFHDYLKLVDSLIQ